MQAQYISLPLNADHFWFEHKMSSTKDHEYDATYRISYVRDTTIGLLTYQVMSRNSIQFKKIGAVINPATYLFRQDIPQEKVYMHINHQDQIVYDFKRIVGDSSTGYKLTWIDSIVLADGRYHLRQSYNSPGHNGLLYVVEGVGCLDGLADPFGASYFENSSQIDCLISRVLSTPVYQGASSGYCGPDVGILQVSGCSVDFFPNPSTNFVHLKSCANIRKAIITNLLGETECVFYIETEELKINLSTLNAGMHFITVVTESGFHTKQLVKTSD